ncbi:MAG: hypothetical protein KA371_18600 [Acidobacteria bacterium]|nr:hypothetical protein [Acidobacteriota bacterium]
MVLTKPELITMLQQDVRIFLHLTGKIEPGMLDYRPTPGQRSTLELVKYHSMMGPALVEAVAAGTFDEAAWTAAEQVGAARTFDEALAAIAGHADFYATAIERLSDDDLRAEIDIFGKAPRGVQLVTWVLNGCVAYRMQLFLYLKACGLSGLNTMNLWGGVDAAP